MPASPQNFVNNVGPVIGAAWLNRVDLATLGLTGNLAGNLVLAAPTSGVGFSVTGGAAGTVAGAAIQIANNNLLTWLDNASSQANVGFVWYDNTNALRLGTATSTRINISANGNVVINVPGSNVALTVTGIGTAFGAAALAVVTGSSGYAQTLSDGTNTSSFLGFSASHNLQLATLASFGIDFLTASLTRMNINATGTITVNAPTAAGYGLVVNGLANSYAGAFKAAATSGQAFGLQVIAGTTNADVAFSVINQAANTNYFQVVGDGGVVVGSPTGGDKGIGTINCTGLFVNGVAVTVP